MKYYIEALHKEGVGSDHLAVGWQLPDGTLERPIPGVRLLPWSDAEAHGPVVNITSPEESEIFTVPTTVTIAADAFSFDGHIREVAFYANGQLLGTDAHAPYEYHWENVPAGRYALTAVAIDDRGRSATSPPVQVIVEEVTCTASGSVLREYWQHIPGSAVRDIPLDTPPDATEALLLFEGPSNAGTHYGARIRGFLCPPATGVYQFWIASNDHSELWLSIDDDPGNTRRIAFTETATGPREWEKHVSQRSGSILLTAGKRYYVEALHKQGAGSDHVAVGWMLPDGTLERPIAGNRLSPYAASTTQTAAPGQEAKLIPQGLQVNVFPNPVHGESVHIRLHTPPATTPDYSSPASMEIIIRRHTGVTEYRHRVEIPEDGEMEIPVHHHFPLPGLYFLQIKVAGKTSMHKLVVP